MIMKFLQITSRELRMMPVVPSLLTGRRRRHGSSAPLHANRRVRHF
jgi:hypothetical protein